ncbi:unnamed protein product [Callosobruchus maculatus]|uniref:Uncharacterized protein n=1 Tax=Callosobruchus maculatus TaxID=64391 RepID=A0A653DQS0_CALMS|nr:unnamed protein product [Callosobruchus maculatus]
MSIVNQDIIIQNQAMVFENQMRIMGQLANQETMLGLICEQLPNSKIASSTSVISDNENYTTTDPLPIDSLTKLEQLAMDLRDEIYMNKLGRMEDCNRRWKSRVWACEYEQFLLKLWPFV